MSDAIDRDDPIWNEVFEHASVAASRAYRRFGRWASHDDLRSAALEYAWRRSDLVASFLHREDEADRRRGASGLIKTLERAAERYARKEKAAACGYKTEDEYFYTEQLAENLILVYCRSDADSAGQVFDPAELGAKRKTKPANEGGDMIAMIADIGDALAKVDDRTRGVLVGRIGYGLTVEQLAASWDVSHQRITQIYQRGLRQVVDLLGGLRP
jgi:DNA-directed RNA polymerase specialized sigma subunit